MDAAAGGRAGLRLILRGCRGIRPRGCPRLDAVSRTPDNVSGGFTRLPGEGNLQRERGAAYGQSTPNLRQL